VTELLEIAVASFVAVTVTFGTPAPFGSDTRPSMFPVLAWDWARTVTEYTRIKETKRPSLIGGNEFLNILVLSLVGYERI
jgi:hypothetical protein